MTNCIRDCMISLHFELATSFRRSCHSYFVAVTALCRAMSALVSDFCGKICFGTEFGVLNDGTLVPDVCRLCVYVTSDIDRHKPHECILHSRIEGRRKNFDDEKEKKKHKELFQFRDINIELKCLHPTEMCCTQLRMALV